MAQGLVRVAQEGISNAVRHRNPTAVDIALAFDAHSTTVMVQDNGTSQKQNSSGLGLVGLEEHLHAIGGALEIHRGAGWRLVGRAPADAQAAT